MPKIDTEILFLLQKKSMTDAQLLKELNRERSASRWVVYSDVWTALDWLATIGKLDSYIEGGALFYRLRNDAQG